MARIRTNKNICLYCFGDLDSDRVCLNCHHKADDNPSPPHHLPQRTVIGPQNRYLIGKALGEGGFGITYLGWDLQQGIKVAVKEYFPSGYVNRVPGNNQVIINSKQNQAASNRGLKRFVEEARALAKIKNLSGVVNVRDFFSSNGTAYIVMEFLDGVSLKKYIQRKGGKIGIDEVLTIMRPVMDSLTQVHKIGLIHRDISPDNILITKHNEVKLIDFGAAKYSNPDGRSLSIVLKQGFAPPEQYDTHGEQGPWTDVYALGVTVYFAITGVLPPESIRIMIGKDTIKRPSELGISIDPGVENALMKSLAVDKKKRYQDVQQMINGLYNPRAPRKTVGSVQTTTTPAPRKTIVPRTAAGTTVEKPQEPTAAVPQQTASSRATARDSAPAVKAPLKPAEPKATPAVKAPLKPAEPKATPAVKAPLKPAEPKATPTVKAPLKPAEPKATPAVKAPLKPAEPKATPAVKAPIKPAAEPKATPAVKAPIKPAAEPKATPAVKAPIKPLEPKATAPKETVKPVAATAKSAAEQPPVKKEEPPKTDDSATATGKTKKPSVFSRLFKK